MIELSFKAGNAVEKQVSPSISEMLADFGSELLTENTTLIFLIALIIVFRKKIGVLLDILLRKIENATEIDLRGIKIKGPLVSKFDDVIIGDGNNVRVSSANSQDYQKLKSEKQRTKYIALVHTIRPTPTEERIDDMRVFEASVYLLPHKNKGHLNDIKEVTYYFGRHWGKNKEFGLKFTVSSANEYFAVSTKLYGACYCVAEVVFHNKSEPEILYRYIDLEMAPVYGVNVDRSTSTAK